MSVKSLVVVFFSLLFAVGCSSSPKVADTKTDSTGANNASIAATPAVTNPDTTKGSVAPAATKARTAQDVATAATNNTGNATSSVANTNQALANQAATVSGKMIRFAFDSSSIDQQSFAILTLHAEFIKASAPKKVVVEGNADERGSREYNLALGERRAIAVKKALEGLGVNGKILETVSFGAEKPAKNGQDEDAWQQNRRVELNYGK